MRPKSWVILIEQLVSDTPEAMCTKWIDLHMLILAGGQERTTDEYAGLYRNAGLALCPQRRASVSFSAEV